MVESFSSFARRYVDFFVEHDERELVEPLGVRLFTQGEALPSIVEELFETKLTLPWCTALKLASEGTPVAIEESTIGCPAGGISLGLIDQDCPEPLEGARPYTDLMEKSAAPADFTKGHVYACKASAHMEFALFGQEDTGRFRSVAAARRALAGMPAIQPANTATAVCYSALGVSLEPQVVVLAVTPRQALRIVQGHAFETGEHVSFDTIGIRGACSEVTALPALEKRLNASFFCLGARALGGWEGDLLALGMPYDVFRRVVTGLEASRQGFPFDRYPE